MARRAIVTGANSGIGRATAAAFAADGCDVGITHFDDDQGAAETLEEVHRHGRRGEARALDLREPARGAEVVGQLAEALGGVDVLVNNAGVPPDRPFLEQDLEGWREVLAVDLDGAFACAQEAARRMIAAGAGGRIVNVTSVHEHVPLRGAVAYCAAKAGLGMLTKSMALELAEHDILVNSLAPGLVNTPMGGAGEIDREQDRPGIPRRRAAEPGEIAAAIVRLAAPEMTYTTGESVVVDGGMLLMAAVYNQDA